MSKAPFLLPLALLLAAAAPESGIDGLLNKHIAWVGGPEAIEKMQTLSLTARLEVSGLSGTVTSIVHRDGWARSDVDLGVLRAAQGVGPDGAWSVNASGQAEPLGAEEEKLLRREIARGFTGIPPAADAAREDLGVEEKDGRSWRVVRFRYPDGDAWDLFLDPADGNRTWARETRDLQTIWHKYEDWRLVEGIRMPYRVLDLNENPSSDQTLTVQSVELNAELPPAAFAPASERRGLFRFDGGIAETDWIPIELHRGAYIYLRGTLNGMETDILLDSGAGMTVIDSTFAHSIGVASAGKVTAVGASGESRAAIAEGITIRIGALQLGPLTAAVIDLSGVERMVSRPMPVILGKELFHALIVDVDYPASRLRVHRTEGFSYSGPGRRLPIYPTQDGHKELDLSIEGLPPARVSLDTGSGGTLDIFKAYAEENRILEKRPRVSEAIAGGVGGRSTRKVFTLASIDIAGFVLTEVPAGVSQAQSGAFHTKRAAGHLGAGILKRFRVIFDYAHECLWLEPGEDWDTKPFERNLTGLLTRRDAGALEVLLVAPGSPAEKDGWETGDRIVAIDGTPVGDTFRDEIDRFGMLRAEGSSVTLRLADGTERPLTLARYY